MTPLEQYMQELAAQLAARGRRRRRVLRECHDHLTDAAADVGEREAITRFGPSGALAAAFDLEIATQRSLRAAASTVLAVLALGTSALALIQAAEPGAHASWPVACVFFLGAQISATAAGLTVLLAATLHRRQASPAELVLLARRATCAVTAGGVTLLAAGVAVPGQGSAALLLAGPVLALVTGALLTRVRAAVRRLPGHADAYPGSVLDELAAFLPLAWRAPSPRALCTATAVLAAVAAYAWDRGDGGGAASALAAAAVEGSAVVVCFVLLGRALALRSPAPGLRRAAGGA